MNTAPKSPSVIVQEILAQTIAPPTEVEQWLDLLRGALTVAEVQALLQHTDLWSMVGTSLERDYGSREQQMRFHINDRAVFEDWLTRYKPHLLGAYQHADAVLRLQNADIERFESWLRMTRPHLVELFEVADTVRRLANG